jgi:transposase
MDCETTNGIGSRIFCPAGKAMSAAMPDNRLFVEAVLYKYRTGIPWRDLPERCGDWKIVHQRFGRWAKSGVFERIFKLLASDHDNEYMMIDATIVRAHQHSAGARKKTANKPSADRVAD